MSIVRPTSGGTHPIGSVMRRGTVLMECVLVLPLLTLLIFSIVQFALIWYAQIMTHYAAYNAARAALVYHPGEYSEYSEDDKREQAKFLQNSGVCYDAACRTLAWVSSSPDDNGGGTQYSTIPGWWPLRSGIIPSSSYIENQVRISAKESFEMTNAPAVQVTVEFACPLHVPVIGKMIAYFENAEDESPSHWDVAGWMPDAAGMLKVDENRHKAMGVDYVKLTSTAVLPKPWKTTRFARRP